jgi:alkanesulfonate monooxygenase SsuD/methylene tetrahydromethanopterin reductase-like flavin-dependent oxidoreductase (luciferase family)
VKLDLLYEIQPKVRPWDLPHPYGQRKAEQESYDEAVAQIQLADRLGFNTVWVVEHHFRDGRSACPASEVVLGGLALSTTQIRLGFGVTLMPFGFIHPARVAEKVATVDVLSHGRVEWGTGRSTPMEQTAFGVPIDDRSRDQWKEAIEIVIGMWAEEKFEYSSPNLEFPSRMQTPKPYQDPHPPVWQAATSDSSAVSAGRYGLGLLSLSLSRTVEQMAEVIASYHAAQAESEPLTHVRNDRVGAYTLVHCCDDLAAAESYGLWDSVEWWYRHLAEFTIEWELPHLSKEAQERAFPLLNLSATSKTDVQRYQDQDMIIIGTPEMCLEKIIRYDEAGVDQLLCYMQFGMLPHETVMHSIELMAEYVMPELERRGHRVTATAVAV